MSLADQACGFDARAQRQSVRTSPDPRPQFAVAQALERDIEYPGFRTRSTGCAGFRRVPGADGRSSDGWHADRSAARDTSDSTTGRRRLFARCIEHGGSHRENADISGHSRDRRMVRKASQVGRKRNGVESTHPRHNRPRLMAGPVARHGRPERLEALPRQGKTLPRPASPGPKLQFGSAQASMEDLPYTASRRAVAPWSRSTLAVPDPG